MSATWVLLSVARAFSHSLEPIAQNAAHVSREAYDECRRADREAHYTEIAAGLRKMDTCKMDSGRASGPTPSNDACELDAHAWLISCVYPWELSSTPTRWVGNRSPIFVGPFKPGHSLRFISERMGVVRKTDAKQAMLADVMYYEAVALLVDG
jgi:hypothetical protein